MKINNNNKKSKENVIRNGAVFFTTKEQNMEQKRKKKKSRLALARVCVAFVKRLVNNKIILRVHNNFLKMSITKSLFRSLIIFGPHICSIALLSK